MTNNFQKTICKALFVFVMLFGIGLVATQATNAQVRDRDQQNRRGRNWDRYGNYGGTSQLRQTALNAGYNEGIKQGRKDRNHRGRDFRDNSAYRNADHDYSNKLGNKNLYQRYYREGYENGYNDGVRGY